MGRPAINLKMIKTVLKKLDLTLVSAPKGITSKDYFSFLCAYCGEVKQDNYKNLSRRATRIDTYGCSDCRPKGKNKHGKYDIDKIRAIVESAGLNLTTKIYVNESQTLEAVCQTCKLPVSTSLSKLTSKLKRGCLGCNECNIRKSKQEGRVGTNQFGNLKKEDIANRFNEYGFTLLEDYLNNCTKHKCVCDCGKKQRMALVDLVRKKCAGCGSPSVSENIICAYFEQLFRKTFEKRRNLFSNEQIQKAYRELGLTGDIPKHLELDGYCKTLKLAFEHNGDQHYKTPKNGKFSKGPKCLSNIKDRDKAKSYLCKKAGITLIIIKQLPSWLESAIRKHIEPSLQAKNYHFDDEAWSMIKIDRNQLHKYGFMNKVINILKDSGCTLLTADPFLQSDIITYLCPKGHKVTKTAGSTGQGHICAKCSGKSRFETSIFKERLKAQNYRALEDLDAKHPDGISANTKIYIECLLCEHKFWRSRRLITDKRESERTECQRCKATK